MRCLISFSMIYCAALLSAYYIPLRAMLKSAIVLSMATMALYFPICRSCGEWVYPLIIIWAVFGALFTVKSLRAQYERYADINIKEKKGIYAGLIERDGQVLTRRKEIDDRALVLGKVYEVVRAMSGMIRSEEIVQAFARFLNENFKYTECFVGLVGSGEGTVLGTLYKIGSGKSQPEECTETGEREKIAACVKSMPEGERAAHDGLRIVPLRQHGVPIAVACFSGLAEKHGQALSLMLSHVSMELKKTRLYEDVERLSLTDGLTEIYLRRHFTERLEEEILRAGRLNLTFAVLMIDIDRFKDTNDGFGHMVGDVVLKEIAGEIKHHIREIDLVSRYGGEEFTVLLPDTTAKTAERVAERIRTSVAEKDISAYDETLRVSISIGIAMFPRDARSHQDIVNRADQAMYRAKQKGRNRVVMYK